MTTTVPLRDRASFRVGVFLTLAVLFVASFFYGVGTGSIPLSPGEIVQAITEGETSQWHRVVWDIRVPRVILAALVAARHWRCPAPYCRR